MSEIKRKFKDLSDIPALSIDATSRIEAIQDEAIDLSDIPELTEAFWINAERGKFYRPKKQQITVNIDADIISWLKSAGRGYQTRLNAILREKMMENMRQQKENFN